MGMGICAIEYDWNRIINKLDFIHIRMLFLNSYIQSILIIIMHASHNSLNGKFFCDRRALPFYRQIKFIFNDF